MSQRFPKRNTQLPSLPLGRGLLVGLILLLAGTPSVSLAGSHKHASKCSVKLNFRIKIPEMLYMSIGSPSGGANTMHLNVAGSSASLNNPGDPSAVATAAGPINMQIRGTVPMKLVATHSPEGLQSNDGTQSIPLSKISWRGAGGPSEGVSEDDGETVLEPFLSHGTINGSYHFIYREPRTPSKGTQPGTVTLTLSSL